jgi:hypothetical protein
MSSALYIVLERKDPAIETYVDGKALSWAEEELKALAGRLGVTPLMDFFSADPEELLAQAEEFNTGLTPDEVPKEQWFPSAEGLKTVRALLEYVDAHPSEFPSAASIANELAGFQFVLEAADKGGIRWHLAVDY